MADRIAAAVERVARHPQSSPVDAEAPDIPDGSTAHKFTVSGYAIRYVYPFTFEGEACAGVVSIRRGNRKALEDPLYLMRWLEERAKRGGRT